MKLNRSMVGIAGRRSRIISALILSVAELLAGCIGDPEPRPHSDLLRLEIMGTGDSLAYAGDTARFSVWIEPAVKDLESYTWTIARSDDASHPDSLNTLEPRLSKTWSAAQAGIYSISVDLKTKSAYWYLPYTFRVRIDSGAPRVDLDSAQEYPFGGANVFNVRATDPNGTVVKYLWSDRQDVFTDSTDAPKWLLPDTLLGYVRIYCRVRDNSGLYSNTAWKSVFFRGKTQGTGGDRFQGIVALSDGTLLAVGHTESFDSRLGEPWILRMDERGTLLSQATVKRDESFGVYGQGEFLTLKAAFGTGFVAAGLYRDSTQDDGMIAGLDDQGNVKWKIFVGDAGNQGFQDDIQADAETHVAVGYSIPDTRTQDTTFGLMTAVNAAGEILYTKTFRRGSSLNFEAITKTRDGNLLVAASGAATAAGQTGYLYKLTPAGDSLWAKPLDNFGPPWIIPHRLVACAGGGYAVLADGYGQSLLIRLDEEGNTLWSKVLFTVKEEWSRSGALLETSAGDLLVGTDLPHGAGPSGIYLLMLDAQGTLLWSRHLAEFGDELNAMAETASGSFIAAGKWTHPTPSGSATTAWIFSFDRQGHMEW